MVARHPLDLGNQVRPLPAPVLLLPDAARRTLVDLMMPMGARQLAVLHALADAPGAWLTAAGIAQAAATTPVAAHQAARALITCGYAEARYPPRTHPDISNHGSRYGIRPAIRPGPRQPVWYHITQAGFIWHHILEEGHACSATETVSEPAATGAATATRPGTRSSGACPGACTSAC